jgi:hypothetical protein
MAPAHRVTVGKTSTMNRRNFIAALAAIPLVGKALASVKPKPAPGSPCAPPSYPKKTKRASQAHPEILPGHAVAVVMSDAEVQVRLANASDSWSDLVGFAVSPVDAEGNVLVALGVGNCVRRFPVCRS